MFLLILVMLNSGSEAASLLSQARADLAAGRYAEVVKEGTQSAALFHQAGDGVGEGRALTAVGLAQQYSGDYAPALSNFNQALALARKTHTVEAEITGLNNIGNVFYFQGGYSGALERYQEALQLAQAHAGEKWAPSRRQLTVANTAILYQTVGQYERALDFYSELLNSPQALPPDEEAQLLANVGTLRRRLGDPQKALQTYRAAQALYKKVAHRDGEIAVLNNIGILEAMDLADFPAAVSTFTTSLRMAEASGDRPLAIHALLYRGEALYRAGQPEKSGADFQVAADQAASLGETEENWKALYGLARIAVSQGKATEADQLLERAIGLIESMRSGLGGSSLRSDFLADKRDVYDLLIEHTGDSARLFELMEASRARNLQDRLRSSTVQNLAALSRALPQDTAVLEYWLGNSSAAVLWVSPGQYGVRRWDFSADQLKAMASLVAVLEDPQRQDWKQQTAALSRPLLSELPPLQQPGIRHLIIVPDGLLGQIPFEVLPESDGKLLIERFSISYLPAASLFTSGAKQRELRWPWQRMFEAFADPSPGLGDGGMELAAARSWPRLPEAAHEVTEIAAAVGGRSAVYLGSEARKKTLQGTPPAPLMHFATHAFADMQDPDRSYILLAPASPAQRFDYLFLKEVSGLRLGGVNLVALSACETDTGKLVRGEGVASFSRAFLGAGARSVMTSLWDVSDRATAQLMIQFYGELARGETKQEALRSAKLDLRRQAGTAHPAYWAAFVLEGESNERAPFVISSWWLAAPLVIIGGAAWLVVRRWARRA